MGFIRWSEAEVKDLVHNTELYRVDGKFTWICRIGVVGDYAVYVAESTSVEFVSKHGHKVQDEVLCAMLFPIVLKAKLTYRS